MGRAVGGGSAGHLWVTTLGVQACCAGAFFLSGPNCGEVSSCCRKAAPLCPILNYTYQTGEIINCLVPNGSEILKCAEALLRDVSLFVCGGTPDFHSHQSHVAVFYKSWHRSGFLIDRLD